MGQILRHQHFVLLTKRAIGVTDSPAYDAVCWKAPAAMLSVVRLQIPVLAVGRVMLQMTRRIPPSAHLGGVVAAVDVRGTMASIAVQFRVQNHENLRVSKNSTPEHAIV